MAQLTTVLTASGDIGTEKYAARLGITKMTLSNTGTGTVQIRRGGAADTIIFELEKTAGVIDIDFKDPLLAEAYGGAGEGDLYCTLPASVTASFVYRNTYVGD